MNAFFDFTIEYPTDFGFGMFSAGHFWWLCGGAVLISLICVRYSRAGEKQRRGLRIRVAGTALLIELLRAAMLMLAGEYDLGRLPLHLCALAVYIGFFHALRPRALTGQFLYAFCLPGAAFALLFPDWDYYPLWHFITASSFALHLLIVCYTLMQVIGGDLVPDIRRAPSCLGIMAAVCVPVYVFDKLSGYNYMFLNWPSEGSPLEWFAFLGRPGYILGYLPIIAAVWAAMYYPFRKKVRTE